MRPWKISPNDASISSCRMPLSARIFSEAVTLSGPPAMSVTRPPALRITCASPRCNPSTAKNIRFFVGKPCRNKEAPQLEREVASEAEGLVAAFKTDASLFLLSEYTVMQRIESGRVTLGKEPTAAASQRVSTVNAS